MNDEYAYSEPFGALYERPAPEPCPGCSCCTRVLCEAGKLHVLGCLGRTDATDAAVRDAIAVCPCDRAPDSARSVVAARLVGVTDRAERKRIVQEIAERFVYRDNMRHAAGGVVDSPVAELLADGHRTGDPT